MHSVFGLSLEAGRPTGPRSRHRRCMTRLWCLQEHGHVPRKIGHLSVSGDIVHTEHDRFFKLPFADAEDVIQGSVPSVILARLDLHRKAFPAGLKDEVQLSIFLFVEVPQLEAVGGEDLGKDIFKNASHVDAQVSIQDVELDTVHPCGAKQSGIGHEELEQCPLFVESQGNGRRGDVVAGEGHARIAQPDKAVFVPGIACCFVDGCQRQ